jgi:hypothetical protein
VSDTPNVEIPYVPEGTLDPAAGLNQALNVIDALLQTAVIEVGRNTPPGGPSNGDLYIVGVGTGVWSGHNNELARYVSEGSTWQFFDPGTQVNIVFDRDTGLIYVYISPSGWFPVETGIDSSGGGGGGVPGGSDQEIQYNASGVFDGSPQFTFNYSTSVLTLGTGSTTVGFDVVGTNGSAIRSTMRNANASGKTEYLIYSSGFSPYTKLGYDNSGVFGYVGTESNAPFRFLVNNNEVLTLTAVPTTGAQIATFSATNKPGSGTAGPTLWLPVQVSGTTYYIPLFGA